LFYLHLPKIKVQTSGLPVIFAALNLMNKAPSLVQIPTWQFTPSLVLCVHTYAQNKEQSGILGFQAAPKHTW
jgi:hypothetical protein